MTALYQLVRPLFASVTALMLLSACATEYPNQNPAGELFPSIEGQSLDQQAYRIPEDLQGEPTLLLIGYRQNAQFDIDRWMIGLDMTGTRVKMIELPTIQGFLPRLFQSRIDNGMRAGIPQALWPVVVTVYEDGERVQAFTGNERPGNARVVLLGDRGQIRFFYDRGFSVAALNDLRAALKQPACISPEQGNSPDSLQCPET
jgi:hypothetical protein